MYYYNRPTASKNRSKLYSHTLYVTIVPDVNNDRLRTVFRSHPIAIDLYSIPLSTPQTSISFIPSRKPFFVVIVIVDVAVVFCGPHSRCGRRRTRSLVRIHARYFTTRPYHIDVPQPWYRAGITLLRC